MISRLGVLPLSNAAARFRLLARNSWGLCHGIGMVKALLRVSIPASQSCIAMPTCSVRPRARHFSHVGVVWSQRILEMRHGSHDLKCVRFVAASSVTSSMAQTLVFRFSAACSVTPHSAGVRVRTIQHGAGRAVRYTLPYILIHQ